MIVHIGESSANESRPTNHQDSETSSTGANRSAAIPPTLVRPRWISSSSDSGGVSFLVVLLSISDYTMLQVQQSQVRLYYAFIPRNFRQRPCCPNVCDLTSITPGWAQQTLVPPQIPPCPGIDLGHSYFHDI